MIRTNASVSPAPLDLHSISQLLYDSMAISAWKRAGTSTWALRCNPSSGNLHPTEAYVLAGPISGLTSDPALLHYAPKEHAVEVLRSIAPVAFDELSRQLPEGALAVGLSTIIWREAWKSGERAFRYSMHDVGHAMQALAIAARVMGWTRTKCNKKPFAPRMSQSGKVQPLELSTEAYGPGVSEGAPKAQ